MPENRWTCLPKLMLVVCLLSFTTVAQTGAGPASSPQGTVTANDLGVSFVEGSTSQIIVERDAKRYVVDLVTHNVRPVSGPGTEPAQSSSAATSASSRRVPARSMPAGAERQDIYQPGDDLVFTLPSGRRLGRHGLYVNFTHRFPYSAAFSGTARGAILLGLDDIAVPSFGVRYGVTSKFSVSAYRSPSLLGRPIELMMAYNLLDEHDGNPFNAAVRFSVDGQNDFSRNFTENFELIVSRSIGRRAQLYAVPTLSVHNRPLLGNNGAVSDPPLNQPCSAPLAAGLSPTFAAHPCANTFSLGLAGAVDIRPTVALVSEVIPTLVNGRELAIHRPAYSFGIQKKIWRHAFTFGFTNSPGTTVSQRAGTRATYLGDPTADKPSGLFVSFDLTRQIF